MTKPEFMNCFIWWITEDLIQIIASQIALQDSFEEVEGEARI